MGKNHFLGEFYNYMKPPYFNTLEKAFVNDNLSENAKFICYSLVVGMLHQNISFLENESKNKKEQLENPWKFRFSALMDWYKHVLTTQEIMDAFEELKQNNVFLAKEFDLEQLLEMERKAMRSTNG